MEIDLLLREVLINDTEIIKKDSKLLFEYYNCKIKQCQNLSSDWFGASNKKSIEEKRSVYGILDFDDCLNFCASKYKDFTEYKKTTYGDVINKYSKKFEDCKENNNCKDGLVKEFKSKDIEKIKANLLKF